MRFTPLLKVVFMGAVGGQCMITITESAATKIKELMPQGDVEYGLRMRVVGGAARDYNIRWAWRRRR